MLHKKASILSITYFVLLYLYNGIQITHTQEVKRLPNNVEPIRYTLTITPYFDEAHSENKNFTFDGKIQIEFKVLEETSNLTFHSEYLNIDKNSLYVRGVNDMEDIYENILNQTIDEEANFYIIDFEETLIQDKIYVIYMEYTGSIKTGPYAFYRSSYTTKNNETRWMGITKFSKMNARKVLPCFDEPALKAIFDIRIVRLPHYISLSNMPLKMTVSTNSSDGRVMDIFESTKKMSTYLVAWIVTDFKKITNEFGNHSTWADENSIEYTKDSLEIAEELLKFLEEYLGIDYQLQKLDHFATYEIGSLAMENWGLITYKEDILIYDPEKVSLYHRTRSLLTLAHEISHQWFGNLVTCKWWTHLWLNEGFARYMEYKALSQVKPEWRIDEQVTTITFQRTFDDDAVALHEDSAIVRPDTTTLLFKSMTIIYEKPAVLLRMFEHVFTPPIFRAGLKNYLIEMSGTSATHEDLWRNLQKAVDESNKTDLNLGGLTVSEIANSWFTKVKYPLVKVERINSTTLKLSQQICSSNATLSDQSDWWIPINFATGKNPDFNDTSASHWLGKDPIYIECDESDWFILNKQRTAYYRVKYDPVEWNKIVNLLLSNNTSIPAVNKGQLFDDSYFLFKYKYIKIDQFLNLTRYLKSETDYIVWKLVEPKLQTVFHKLPMSNETYHREYMYNLIQLVYDSIDGFNEKPSDDYITKIKRPDVLNLACSIEYKKCIEDANNLFINFYSGKINAISPNVMSVLYTYGLYQASNDTWQLIFNRMNETEDGQERSKLLKVLGCANVTHKINEYLLYLLDFDGNGLYEIESTGALLDLFPCYPQPTDSSVKFFEEHYDFLTNGLESTQQSYFAMAIMRLLPKGIQHEKLRTFIANSKKIYYSTKQYLESKLTPNLDLDAQSEDEQETNDILLWFNNEHLRMESEKQNDKENEILDENQLKKNKKKSLDESIGNDSI